MRDTAEVRSAPARSGASPRRVSWTRIDPESGRVLATIGLGIVKPGGLAFGEGSVWVTDAYSPTLLRIDPAVDEVVDRFPLPTSEVVTDLTGGIAVGADPSGSVMGVEPGRLGGAPRPGDRSHPAPLPDPRRRRGLTRLRRRRPLGREQRGRRGPEVRPTDERDLVHQVSRPGSHPLIAAGGGFAWAAGSPEASLWKIQWRNGGLVDTVELPAPAKDVTFTAPALSTAHRRARPPRQDRPNDRMRRSRTPSAAT